ncbi:hypothetical protein GCM10009801_54020 [Streptomyces albiaxialis]|uniref:CSD domain-containing protein n=1 Tax=Streptomyces albiaxialis TaxID=329523 RepID=A0ABN2WDW7_9ACTN
MPEGTVVWFDSEQGVGVIAQDHGGPDIAAHHSAVLGPATRALLPGERVRFDLTLDAKGTRADNILPLGRARTRSP